MANETMLKFGFPGTLIREYRHWVVLLRPAQVTLGSLVLAAKSDVTAFGALPGDAHAELATVSRDIEATLLAEIGYDKINYLMLMMVDPHVHFHIFPRYQSARTLAGMTIEDAGWPGPPDLKSGVTLDADVRAALLGRLSKSWLNSN